MKYHLCILLSVFWLSELSVVAQPAFRTAELKRLAEATGLQTDSLPQGYSHQQINGHQYALHVENGMIDHIGLSLFKTELKAVAKSPVLNFLERYFLLLKFPGEKTAEYLLRADRFRFLKGNLSTITQIRDSDIFSFHYEIGSYYASWKRNGRELLAVSFPKEHELLSGENKIEAELLFENDARNFHMRHPHLPPIDKEMLTSGVQQGFFMMQGNNYLTKDITNTLYFKEDSLKSLKLICDISHPKESTANMMLSPYTEGQYTLCISQALYGYKRKQFNLPLARWIAYCQARNCQLFFGIETADNNKITATVFAVNQAEGYNHLLHVDIPLRVIDNKQGNISARLDTYIPMANVYNLFERYHKNKRITQRIYEK